MKQFLALSLIALIAPLVIFVAPAGAAGDVNIPVILSLTGPAGFLGQKEQASLRALETTVNANGGLRGRTVHLDFADDQSNPQVTVQLVSALVAKHAPVIMGPNFTATCQAVSALVDKNGPLTYCLSPAIFPRPNGYMFMSGPSIDDVQPIIFRYLLTRKLTNVAMITSTDASGADFEKRVDGVLAAPEFKAIKVVTREHFSPTDISTAAQMSRIKASGADVLLTFTVGTPFGTLLKGISDAGLDIPVYGSGGNFTYAQMQQYASFLPKELFLNGQRGITPDPAATGSVRRAQDAYFTALSKAGIRSEFASAIPWDPMNIVFEAMRRAGPDADAKKLWSTLQSIKGYPGIEGTYDFTTHDQRGIGGSAAALFRYDKAKNTFNQFYP
jgi:branched-chain amino acid transport system substrate-binding protein